MGVRRCGKLFLGLYLLIWVKKGTQKAIRMTKLLPQKLCTTFPQPHSQFLHSAKVAAVGRSSEGLTVSLTLSTPFLIILYSIPYSLSL